MSGMEFDSDKGKSLLENSTYGLSALKVLIDAVENKLDHSSHGLAALKLLIDAVENKLDSPVFGLTQLDAEIDAIEDKLDDASFGLNALRLLILAVEAKLDAPRWHYLDHNTDVVDESPPILNNWYEVFHDEDVRLIFCTVYQTNDETAAKDIEVRWTIDGNEYFRAFSLADSTTEFLYRQADPGVAGVSGLWHQVGWTTAAFHSDKRGQHFKVEVRITSVLGTNQRLRCYCVRETLEIT